MDKFCGMHEWRTTYPLTEVMICASFISCLLHNALVMQREYQYKAELTLSPRLHVKPLITAKGAIFKQPNPGQSSQNCFSGKKRMTLTQPTEHPSLVQTCFFSDQYKQLVTVTDIV